MPLRWLHITRLIMRLIDRGNIICSVVNPEARSLRLANIAKTWGPSSNAIFVVHNMNEYVDGQNIDEAPESRTYPQNLLLPEQIYVDAGVARLEHVIRKLHKDINAEFVFFVNDHTFVLPGNLCKFLKEHDSSKGLYAGHALKRKSETAFNSGAAGYVLSRTTIEKLINEWDKPDSKCSLASASKWLQGNPGLLTAQCFQQVLNISLVDTRDKVDLSHKFHAYGLVRTVTGAVDLWYENSHKTLDEILEVDSKYHHKLQHGTKCCSVDTVSFHYVESEECLAFWDVLDKVNASPLMSDTDLIDLLMKTWPSQKEALGFYAHALPDTQPEILSEILQVVRKVSAGVLPKMC